MFGVSYPEGGVWPDWVWQLIADIGIVAAIAATIAGVIFLWNHGPGLLVKYGPNWMTRLGLTWGGKREAKKEAKRAKEEGADHGTEDS
jgi:hypothetical protein